jgi:peptidoglycan hydrolase-like protein with peptidoglycan-binding domain
MLRINGRIYKSVISVVAGSVLSLAMSTTNANAASESMPVLGDSGASVTQLQQALISRGFTLKGGADGVFGVTTRNTLKSFQRIVGFRATGTVDERTAKFLGLVAPKQLDPKALPIAGTKSEEVRSLQQALANNGVPVKGGADGVFGLATKIAIAKFQSSKSLPITQVIDSATAAALGLISQTAVVQPAVVKAVAQPVVASATASAVKPAESTIDGMLTIDTLPTRGQKSDAVRLVQEKLIANSIEVKGGVDGIFGPATAIAIAAFQTSRGLKVTSAIDLSTAIALGVLPDLATLGIPQISVFPSQGRCSFADSWQQSRPGGRQHEGVDIMGVKGLAVYAVIDGTITKMYGADAVLSGNALRLTGSDGTYFFYAHLDSFAPGIAIGSAVRAGQIIGYMGSTGFAGSPHLHFEVHPKGGAAVSPYPIVKAVDACEVTDVLPQS